MNGKTIDDIIRESDIISALSSVPADVTNVETVNTFARQTPIYAQSQYSMREMEPQISMPGLGLLEYATSPAAASASFLKSLLGGGAKKPIKLLKKDQEKLKRLLKSLKKDQENLKNKLN